jgi:hypothetical protein
MTMMTDTTTASRLDAPAQSGPALLTDGEIAAVGGGLVYETEVYVALASPIVLGPVGALLSTAAAGYVATMAWWDYQLSTAYKLN